MSDTMRIEILPDGSITAIRERPAEVGELLTFRENLPTSY